MRLTEPLRRARRRRARSAVKLLLRQLPSLLRLLYRLLRDPRVGTLDKALVALAAAYLLSPIDLVPDFIAGLGLADDLFLMGLALNHLLASAGPDLLLEHWDGDPRALAVLVEGVEDIGSVLPRRVRRLLRGVARSA